MKTTWLRCNWRVLVGGRTEGSRKFLIIFPPMVDPRPRHHFFHVFQHFPLVFPSFNLSWWLLSYFQFFFLRFERSHLSSSPRFSYLIFLDADRLASFLSLFFLKSPCTMYARVALPLKTRRRVFDGRVYILDVSGGFGILWLILGWLLGWEGVAWEDDRAGEGRTDG
ncbi:hypothetical protein IWZ01DRAFT_262964 [Phyllosticta capitalensis]